MQFPRKLDAAAGTLLASAFLVAACNAAFWRGFVDATGGFRAGHLPLYVSTFLILTLLLNALLTLVTFRVLFKPVLVVLFLVTSAAVYFTQRYGVLIDSGMIQNVFETDVREALDLLDWRMFVPIFMLGVLPSVVVLCIRFESRPFWRDLLRRIAIAAACVAVALLLVLVGFKTYAPTFRQHRELQYQVMPFSYIDATRKYLRKNVKPAVVAPIGVDAVKGPMWVGRTRRTVTVIVVGETARAMNFSLNGYARETNPRLAREEGLVNFTDVSSCGTATAVSVPCMFSMFGRADYSDARARSQEGLLDVLKHAGFDVLWRDNNSGCKGTCDRVRYEDVSIPADGDPFCEGDECHDERLLRGLPGMIREARGDLVIVLHQLGNHGPAYWKRYPPAFAKWSPVCATADLSKCSTAEIVAAYDNAILYTDYVLSSAIDLLREAAADGQADTAFLYVSDHGESLGEKNLYLHGTPYFMAPSEQTHVPMMLWMSDGFRSRFGIDAKCLTARSHEPLSHDNLFHSVLGMLGVSTAIYDPGRDLLHACSRHTQPVEAEPGRGMPARKGDTT